MPLIRMIRWFNARWARWPGDVRVDLPLPVVDVLDDIPGGETNLLPSSAWLNPLRVEFPMWLNSEPSTQQPEYLSVYWDGALLETKSWTQPVLPDELFIMVPVVRLSEGEHRLEYTVQTYNGVEAKSGILTLTVDKTPPFLVSQGPLMFPPEVVSGGVTEAYLKAHADQLLAEVPTYQVPKPGDVITWYWSSSLTGSEVVGTKTLTLADIGQPISLIFAGQVIRDRGDGTRYGFYTLQDRAGNASPRALAVELHVAATPIPRKLPPSKVKEATGGGSSGVLAPSNGINGVTVVIPPEAIIYDGEPVSVQWAEPGSVGAWRTETPVTPGSRDYKIPGDKIAPYLGNTLPVYYEVIEAGTVLKSDSYSLRVEVLSSPPVIQCDEVSGGKLSLKSLTDGYANFTLERWSYMATEQYLTITVRGTDANNQLVEVPVLTESPVPEVAQKISVGRISKTDLQRFKIGGGLEVKVRVSFDDKGSWKDFPSLKPTLVS